MRIRGQVSSFSRRGTYIFIRPEGRVAPTFCHRSDVHGADRLREGCSVEFELGRDDFGTRAVRVVALTGV
ncbi:MAG: cold shock domain-containing protein [Candidatus Wallbacteria bacterium]|nr:cold shock domain-containing protein [Candidatus Wallbacteria bacterium]